MKYSDEDKDRLVTLSHEKRDQNRLTWDEAIAAARKEIPAFRSVPFPKVKSTFVAWNGKKAGKSWSKTKKGHGAGIPGLIPQTAPEQLSTATAGREQQAPALPKDKFALALELIKSGREMFSAAERLLGSPVDVVQQSSPSEEPAKKPRRARK